MVMGLLDRVRAAYEAGRKEEADRQESAASERKLNEIAREGQRVYQRRKEAEDEERNPSQIGRTAGRIMYRGEQLAERASYYGGRIASEVERFNVAGDEARMTENQNRPRQRTSRPVVSRSTQRTSSLWGFTPTRSQATRSVTPQKRKSRRKSSHDPFDISFDFW